MPNERVGFRRLYRSRGISLKDRDSWENSFNRGELQIEVYLGPKPQLGIFAGTGDKYFVPAAGETAALFSGMYYHDATQVPGVGAFFTEIRVSTLVDVSEELSASAKTVRRLFIAGVDKSFRKPEPTIGKAKRNVCASLSR